MTWILSALRYWKAGGIALLVLALFLSSHMAHRRGHERDMLRQQLTKTIQQYNTLEKARQQDKNRNEFRAKQNKKLKFAQNDPVPFGPDLRNVYDSLRERQTGSSR